MLGKREALIMAVVWNTLLSSHLILWNLNRCGAIDTECGGGLLTQGKRVSLKFVVNVF